MVRVKEKGEGEIVKGRKIKKKSETEGEKKVRNFPSDIKGY